jgi:hypothetical protein
VVAVVAWVQGYISVDITTVGCVVRFVKGVVRSIFIGRVVGFVKKVGRRVVRVGKGVVKGVVKGVFKGVGAVGTEVVVSKADSADEMEEKR